MSMSDYEPLSGTEKTKILNRIGVARGVVVMRAKGDRRIKPFLVRIYDSATKKYDNTAFDDLDALVLHARTTWMNFQTGEAAAGRVLLETIRPRFMASARQTCDGMQLESYNRVFDRLKSAHVTDLKSPSLQADCIVMLEKLAAGTPSRIVDGKRIKKQRAWKAGTWNAYVHMLRTIGNWCTKKANRVLLRDNPFDDFPLRAESKAMPAIYTVEEMRKIAQPAMLETEIGRLLVVLLYTGMRLNEARWLRWSSFDWRVGVVNVTLPDTGDLEQARKLGIKTDPTQRDLRRKSIKTDEERAIPLERELVDLLRPWAGVGDGYVFSDRFIALKSEQYMWRAQCMVFKKLGIRKRARALHVFRHTYACVLEGAGLPRVALKRRLGHSSKCNTTEGYLKAAHIIAKDVQDWGREFRLVGDLGSNQGATVPSNMEQDGVVAMVGGKGYEMMVSHGNSLNYDGSLHANECAPSYSIMTTQHLPIQLMPVRFRPLAPIVSADEVVVLGLDDEAAG